ncbi:MAG TPA: hypothetical protein VML75_05650 [Kofleriaceae bacterium]|nr:hypothetical protein [Kofleriaceae bacterium]
MPLLALLACSSGASPDPEPTPTPVAPAIASDASPPATAFVADAALAIIEERVRQSEPKMKLTPAAGAAAARYVDTHLDRSAALRRLHASMPHSTVELVRAIEERGVPAEEADRIARYLVHLVETLDFAKLRRFDINHSHVTGREWHEIDYTGEGMTWQGQQKYWSKKGVIDFKRAAYIHAYMTHAYRLPHFARVYAPRGTIDAVAQPGAPGGP